MVITFQRMFLFMTSTAAFGRHGLLPLVADDGIPGNVDAHALGYLELQRLVADPRDGAVDSARRDHLIAHLQTRQKVGHLLLPPFHRQQNDEIEDGQHEREGQQLHQRARRALRRRSHGKYERSGHESSDRREAERRNSCLNLSKVRNDIASLILRMVSR